MEHRRWRGRRGREGRLGLEEEDSGKMICSQNAGALSQLLHTLLSTIQTAQTARVHPLIPHAWAVARVTSWNRGAHRSRINPRPLPPPAHPRPSHYYYSHTPRDIEAAGGKITNEYDSVMKVGWTWGEERERNALHLLRLSPLRTEPVLCQTKPPACVERPSPPLGAGATD